MVKISIINNGEEFEIPKKTVGDEEALWEEVIKTKAYYLKKYGNVATSIKEVEAKAQNEGYYAFLTSILKRVDSSITKDKLKALSGKETNTLIEAFILANKPEGVDEDFFQKLLEKNTEKAPKEA